MVVRGPIFLLDTNVLIEAHRRYYAFDICPGFWEFLGTAFPSVRSIDEVRNEITGNDPLAVWAGDAPEGFFESTKSADTIDSYEEIMDWVSGQQQYHAQAKADFAKGADGWLIAHARVRGYAVVTLEVLSEDIKRRVPIPNVCKVFGVPWISTFGMLRQEEARFVLG